MREKLGRGFYVNNLYDMARLCKELALDDDNPAPFYVMQHVFSDIARHWEDRPIVVEEAKLVETEITKTIWILIDTIESGAPVEQVYNMLGEVLKSYQFLFR